MSLSAGPTPELITLSKNLIQKCLKEPNSYEIYVDDVKKTIEPNEDGGAVTAAGGAKLIFSLGETVFYLPTVEHVFMQNEKLAADQVASLGIKTNHYKISKLRIVNVKDSNETNGLVLSAPHFKALAEKEQISILEPSKMEPTAGLPIEIDAKDLTNVQWIEIFIKKLIQEITFGLAYGIPLRGDTLNFYFQHKTLNHPSQSLHLFLFDFTSKHGTELFSSYIKSTPELPSKAIILATLESTLRTTQGFCNVNLEQVLNQHRDLVSTLIDEALVKLMAHSAKDEIAPQQTYVINYGTKKTETNEKSNNPELTFKEKMRQTNT